MDRLTSDEEEPNTMVRATSQDSVDVCATAHAGAPPAARSEGSRLGLCFTGLPGGGMSPLSWRDGRFSDWTVQVGEKSYRLHAFILARASVYFESQISVARSSENTQAS